MKTERRITRAIYAVQMKKCPHCGRKIERDDLIMEETITTGRRRKRMEYDYNTGAKVAVHHPEIKHKVWHKSCWYAAHGEEEWYRPGIMAEDLGEDNPRRLPMKRRYYRNPQLKRASEGDRGVTINLPQATPVPVAPTTTRGGWGWIFILLVIGGGGFAAYWFLWRHKYEVGQNLQHIGDTAGLTYQITELKYAGLVHTYVMQDNAGGTPVEHPVSEIDGDANWQPV